MDELDTLSQVLENGWGMKLASAASLKPGRTWRVTLHNAESYILKNWGPRDAGLEERVWFYQDVMRHVSKHGLGAEIALPCIGSLGDVRTQVIFRAAGNAWWLTNELPNDPTPLQAEDIDAMQTSYGRSIAFLHRALALYPLEMAQKKTWSKDIGREIVDQSLPSIRGKLTGTQREEFEALVAPHEREVAERLENLPRQLIYYDCHHGNILRVGCRVTGFVDSDHLSIGIRIWDLFYLLAQGIHDIRQETADTWPHHAHVTIDAYSEVNPLSDRERAAIWAGMFAFKLNMLAYVLSGSNLDTADCLFDHLQRLTWVRPHFE